jgi:arsenite-transporting ATPase
MTPRTAGAFSGQVRRLRDAFERLKPRRLILFGGKGGVGKTTIASLAALHLAESRATVLFSTDPASNLADLWGGDARSPENLRIASIDAEALWDAFLAEHLDSFVELGDRGTYLDRDEIRNLFTLSIPGIDELMGWLEIGAIAEANPEATLVVDTAPTGHTLRLLSSSHHFEHLASALEEMQAKHRALVTQLTRRQATDAIDAFLAAFRARFERRAALLADRSATAFVPVFLAEPLVTAQTLRLAEEVRSLPIDVPLAILNQAAHDCDCAACALRSMREEEAIEAMKLDVVRAPRACVPLEDSAALLAYLDGKDRREDAGSHASPARASSRLRLDPRPRLLFVAGKGGVGKTTTASSIALQLASRGLRTVLISVDPAHSVVDVFAEGSPHQSLRIETIDTRGKWRRLTARLGSDIERAIGGLTAPNISISHDAEVLRELLEIAPPGADEIFAVMRLADLLEDAETDIAVVDTAPTGHFLRLLDLPRTAGEWTREMMRLLLRYKELVPPGALAEELLDASKALRRIGAALGSEETAAVIVTRAEPLVAAETRRLRDALAERGMRIGATVVNALTPRGHCACDASRRAGELGIAAAFPGPVVAIDRLAAPPSSLDSLRALIPLE